MVAVEDVFVVERDRAVDLAAFDLLGGGAIAETDAARLRADFDDFEFVFFARFERPRAFQRTGGGAVHRCGRTFVATLAIFDLGVVAKRFDVVAQFHESAEGGDARNFALHDLNRPCAA